MSKLTLAEVATEKRVHPETVARWIRSGRLRAERIGSKWLIDRNDLEAATRTNVATVHSPDLHTMRDPHPVHTMREGKPPTR